MKTFGAALSLALGLALSIAACGGAPAATTAPTPVVVATYLTAEITGTLVDEAGCLQVASEDGSYLLVWPPDNAVTREGATVRVATGTISGAPGEWQMRLGDTVRLGGGNLDRLDDVLAATVTPGCDGPYWVMGQIGEVVATATP